MILIILHPLEAYKAQVNYDKGHIAEQVKDYTHNRCSHSPATDLV